MSASAEDAAISRAALLRTQCICRENGSSPCACATPVTREQVGRLNAYAAAHPERAFAYSEKAGQWISARRAFLPEGEDAAAAWLQDPLNLPPAACLYHAGDLGALLDVLGAPTAAQLS